MVTVITGINFMANPSNTIAPKIPKPIPNEIKTSFTFCICSSSPLREFRFLDFQSLPFPTLKTSCNRMLRLI